MTTRSADLEALDELEYQIKAILPEYVSYHEIKCVAEAWRRGREDTHERQIRNGETPSARPPAQRTELTGDPIESATQFDRLRKWRLERSKANNVPPYVVFSDEALRGIVNAQPRMVEDLLNVRGVGQMKMERYGAEVLRVMGETLSG